jgi:outer membrane receptor for ferrienterochelin and colicin
MNIFAQSNPINERISIEIVDKTIPEALKLLKTKSQLSLVYSNNILPKDRKITIKTKKQIVEVVLIKILKNTNIRYKVLGEKVILFKAQKSKYYDQKSLDIKGKGLVPKIKEKFTLSGYIIDKETGEKLIGANVFVPILNSGTSSNAYGFYSLTIPEGNYDIEVSYIGYEAVKHAIKLSGSTNYDFNLGNSVDLVEVEVIASKNLAKIEEKTQMSSMSVPMDQVKALPSLGGEIDLLRTIQLLPGVSSGNEATSGLFVRGGSHDQNLVLLDGVPVYNSFHLFGFLSVFNTDAINNIELIKGGFPARYGGRLSSIMDIRLKEGSLKKFKGSGTISPVSTKLTLEAPIIKDKMSFIVSGRRTFADLIMRPITRNQKKQDGATGGSTGYFFYDFNAKLNYKISDKDRLYLSMYGGKDTFDDSHEQRYTFSSNIVDTKNYSAIDWGNNIAALRWNHLFSDKLFGNLTLHFSNYTLDVTREEQERFFEGSEESKFVQNYTNYKSEVLDKGLRLDFDYVPSPNHYIRFGGNLTHHNFSPGVNAFQNKDTEININRDTVYNNIDYKSWEYFAYVEDDFKIGPYLKFNIGLHASIFAVENHAFSSLQPRFSARYLIADNWSIKAAYSQMSQPLHLLTNSGVGLPTDLWITPTKDIAPQKSQQTAFGFAHTLDNGLEVSVETYYKKMNNLVAYKEGSSFLLNSEGIEDKIVQGEGDSYGGELFVQKKTGKTTGWFSYTLSWSNRQFDQLNFGKSFPFKYDRRHDFTLALVHQLNKKIRLSATWVFASSNALNLPIREFDINEAFNEESDSFYPVVLDYGSKNNYRLAPYHRLDLGISFHKKTKWGKQSFDISVYNAYNRKNPFYVNREYTSDGPKFKQTSLFPIIPSVSYNFQF